ncbi:hypothetical protein G6F51_012118 [Rhizopus arrhizus]|uniref:Tyr recombinase domain-containing protein n=1 Tax=Rhizopus oryzae TaxID=64495 RepID=A0A9P6XX00_RHIOR|nr:hypothetical protein G6F51_012118 [Rhizopus arrhizus]
MANNPNSIPTDSTTMGPVLDRPLCRQDNQVVTKLRVLASGSGRYPYGCLHSTMDELDEAFRKSPMESDISGSEQDTSREASSSGNGGTVLADTSNSSNNMSQNTSPSTTQELDAIRVAIIRNKLESQHLNENAVSDLLRQRLAPTATNKGYCKNQLRFLEWAQQHKVSFTAFSGVDMVNFLADIRQSHGLQVATLKTMRAAVAHLHDNTNSISTNPLVNSYLDSLSKQAAPVAIHRPTVDMFPALVYARTIPSRSTTPLQVLQQKLTFLLAMSAFLRPSDLARIPFASCGISTSGCLLFQVVAPKETRKKRRIIKPFTVHPHASDNELCPVQCFKALRDHPAMRSRREDFLLFVKSNNIHPPLSSSTISSWLHRGFISLCTSESGVSLRSLASSRALDLGVSRDDIVTLGNWASSDTFTQHYQRNHMANVDVDFTSVVLSGVEDDDFFDAQDSFSGSAQ